MPRTCKKAPALRACGGTPTLCTALCALLLSACVTVDYDFKGKGFRRRVVVNALLTPQETFTVRLHWSGTYAEGENYTPVADAEIRLFEGKTEVVRCPASGGGVTETTFIAVPGRRYRLEVSVPDYGELWAETSVPEAPVATISHVMYKGWYRHFDLAALTVPADAKAVWLRGYRIREGELEKLWGYYTASAFVDQVNGSNDAYEADEKGCTIDFEEFLRIPYENCTAAVPLRFSVDGNTEGTHLFRVITASDTYDRYMRSRYKQTLNTEEGAEDNPFTEQITVYSNVANGLGVFAGYNYYTSPEL